MVSQSIAFLAAAALLAFAIATLLAGRSLWIVTRAVIGWSFAVLAAVLAFAALIIVAVQYLSDHATTEPVSGALAIGGALVCVGLTAKVTTRRRQTARLAATVRRSQTAGAAPKGSTGVRTADAFPIAPMPARGVPNGSSASRLAATPAPAAGDATLALISLGYSKAEAASAIADAVASLGANAETALLIKAALRARTLSGGLGS
jgi:hypothetical protein